MASPQSKSVLNDAEREITKTVIRRFVSLDKSTSQRFLLKELKPFRGSLVEALRVLVGHSILNIVHDTHGEERYSPRAIAFHYCGDADALTFAKKSTEIILSVVQNLYEHELEAGANEQKPFTRQNAEAEARSIDPAVTPEMIWVGLALAEEFSIFRTLQRNTQQIGVTTFLPSPHIFELADNPWDGGFRVFPLKEAGKQDKVTRHWLQECLDRTPVKEKNQRPTKLRLRPMPLFGRLVPAVLAQSSWSRHLKRKNLH